MNWHQIPEHPVEPPQELWLPSTREVESQCQLLPFHSGIPLITCDILCSNTWLHHCLAFLGKWGVEKIAGISQRKTWVFILIRSFSKITLLAFLFPLDPNHLLCLTIVVSHKCESIYTFSSLKCRWLKDRSCFISFICFQGMTQGKGSTSVWWNTELYEK